MTPITNDTVMDFIRMLINLGGIDFLKEPEMLILNKDGEPRCIDDGDKAKPIQIIVPGMVKDDNYFLFNPLKAVEGNNPAYVWFYMSRGSNIAVITKMIMLKLIELAVAKETADYESLQLIADLSSVCDEQMLTELTKINASDILRIFWNKRLKTAEAQTLLFSDEIETQYKLRKKSWTTIRKIFKTIFDLGDDNTMSKFHYRAVILNIPEIDAKLHVISKLIKKLESWSQIIGVTFEADKFEEHLKNLETYARMYAWFTVRSVVGQNIISNQQKSSGLPLVPPKSADNDTTIKLGSPPVYPQPVQMPQQPMTPYGTSMTPYPMTPYGMPQMSPYGSMGIPMATQPQVVEHDRIPIC